MHRETAGMCAHRGKTAWGPREKVAINNERAEASGETDSADHLILHSLPPEPQENKFLLFKTIQPVVFCYCCQSWLTHSRSVNSRTWCGPSHHRVPSPMKETDQLADTGSLVWWVLWGRSKVCLRDDRWAKSGKRQVYQAIKREGTPGRENSKDKGSQNFRNH